MSYLCIYSSNDSVLFLCVSIYCIILYNHSDFASAMKCDMQWYSAHLRQSLTDSSNMWNKGVQHLRTLHKQVKQVKIGASTTRKKITPSVKCSQSRLKIIFVLYFSALTFP